MWASPSESRTPILIRRIWLTQANDKLGFIFTDAAFIINGDTMASMQTEQPKKQATTMKAVRIHTFGGPEVLKCEDVPKPQARTSEALVRVKAAGVNPIDWKVRAGYRKEMLGDMLPLTLGVDMAGVVEKTGDGVKDFKRIENETLINVSKKSGDIDVIIEY